ncbi:hypothetical protein Vadar_025828 [Vaccinium darrowii]|uniref:Uncharacterized protein n=1 Tax=Vaccinium darrowii TaxID=229202 RepID=A0ACB7ZML2_9ERIC|nr:hypothetical protein Vadar_025828 [Vaccinium darrowii]
MTAEDHRAQAVWRTRLGSAYRTALACTMVGCTTLYGPEPLRTQIPFPAFAYLTAILIVPDATLGDSVRGCWHAMCATAQVVPASILSLWLIGPEQFSEIVIVYVTAVVYGRETGDAMHPIHAAASTALGALASFLALLFPYPRLAYSEVNKLSRLYTQNASERFRLLMKAFSAQNTTIALETISQTKPLQETGAKLLQSIKLTQFIRNVGARELHEDDFVSEDDADDDEEVDEDFECEDDEGLLMEGYGEEEEMRSSCLLEGVQWERPQIRPKPQFRKPGDRLQDIESQIRGMEMALTCCSSFPVIFTDQEQREVLLAMELQIGLKLEQTKCFPALADSSTAPQRKKGELFNKFLDSLKTLNPNSENQTASFFLSCIKLLLDDSTNTQKNPTRNVEKSNDKESKNSIKEAIHRSKNMPKKEALLFAFTCSISLGLAVFFGLVFNKENGYWSGLTIAISFTSQRQATFKEANARAQGTALGSVYGVLGCSLFSKYPELRILELLPWIIFTSFLQHGRIYGQAGGVSTVIGALLILGRKNYGPPAEFAITRLTEAFIGLFCFITVKLVLQPTRAATLAKRQLSQSLGALREFISQVGISPDEKDMDFVFLTLRQKQEKLKIRVNQLEKFAGESELEPNFWFLPFRVACYSNLIASISKMVDLLHFMVVQMQSLMEESLICGVTWKEFQEHIDSDLYLFKKHVSSSLHFLEKITMVESFSVFEREEKEIHNDLELGRSSNADWCIAEAEKIISSIIHHSNEVTEKFWAEEGEERSKSQMALCQSAVRFCICGLMRETKEIERGIKELVQWENPSNRISFYELSGKINALFPE